MAKTGTPVPGLGGGSVWPAFGLTPTNSLTGLALKQNINSWGNDITTSDRV